MATKPTPGGSDGTYGTEMNAFLDVSLASDGKIINEALQTASTAPVADAALANKKYVDDVTTSGASVTHDAEGGFNNCDVDGANTKVYTKYFTGTTDADSATVVAHGITGIDKILHVSVVVANSNSSNYLTGSNFRDAVADTFTYEVTFDGTNVNITSVGAESQSEKYRIKIDYKL